MMRHHVMALLALLVFTALLCAQDVSGGLQSEILFPADSYLVPQTVYVGDNGRLVVAPGYAFNDAPVFIITNPDELPVVTDLVIRRMELERRNNNVRLLIDFVSYAPGVFSVPPVAIQTPQGVLFLGGLHFPVASILTPESMSLAGPALPLAVPGTGMLVYGGLALAVSIIAIAIAVMVNFSRLLDPIRERIKRRKLIISLEKKIALLQTDDFTNNTAGRNELFSLLATEFRKLIGILSGVNCSAMTPYEFTTLTVAVPGVSDSDFFYSLFSRWDKLRFSGQSILQDDVRVITGELLTFFANYKKAEKGS